MQAEILELQPISRYVVQSNGNETAMVGKIRTEQVQSFRFQ